VRKITYAAPTRTYVTFGAGHPEWAGDETIIQEDIMRTIVFMGATALSLALGAVSAAAGNSTPIESPYAILAPTTMAPPESQTTLFDSSAPAKVQPMYEGRAAFVGDKKDCRPARVRIQNVWRDAQICD